MMRAIILFALLLISTASAIDDENNVSVGYQIGGNTLIGVDYEIRLTNLLGVHGGLGYLGYGLGTRFHFDEDQHSPYVDLNYKDCGLGLMQSIGLELGGTWLVQRHSGIRGSIGVQKILSIKESFKNQLIGEKSVPSMLLAIQIGWAW